MSGTSQWPMSELNIARSRAPSGLRVGVERPRDGRVVGLAAEVEARHEQVAHVLGALDPAARRHSSSVGGSGSSFVNDSRQPGEIGAEALVAVLREQLHQRASTSMRAGSRCWIASRLRFSQCDEQVGVERARPADAALEQAEAELREAARDAAQEERLAGRLHARAERADVVVHVVRDRAAAAPAHAGRVRSRARRRARGSAATPGRSRTRCRGRACRGAARSPSPSSGRCGRRAAAAPPTGRCTIPLIMIALKPSFADRVVELRDRLVGRVHRDLRDRRHAVGVREVDLGVERVERAARHLAQLGVEDRERREPAARVEHREVDAELVEPLVEQARQVRGGAVERVRGGQAPPRRARGPELAPALASESALHGRSTMSSKSIPPAASKRAARSPPPMSFT